MTFKSGYVAILGEPNAGKSTLLNELLGEKISIVTAKPQTTRRNFLGIRSSEEGQVLFLDTPGLHRSDKELNRFMMGEAKRAVDDADVVVILLTMEHSLPTLLIQVFKECVKKNKHVIIAVNKCDLPEKKRRLNQVDVRRAFPDLEPILISALIPHGLPVLMEKIMELLPEGPAYYPEDELTNESMRDIASEIIREKAMELLHQEIPYSLAIEIESYKEQKDVTRIVASLAVEAESQKGMVIGAGAKKIKEIGTRSRQALIKLLGRKVHLELNVKVDKAWTKNPEKMANYGYKPR